MPAASNFATFKFSKFITLASTALLASTVVTLANPLAISAINQADPMAGESKAAMIKLQTLLDRAGSSPTIIDGLMGPSTEKAISAFEMMQGLPVDGQLDADVWSALSGSGSMTIAKVYTLTQEDVNQQLIAETPDDYAKMAELDCLCYHRVSEAIAEKFHMDEELLLELNPQADFSNAGQELTVVEPGPAVSAEVAKIEIDKAREQLFAYDASGALVFAAGAVVGSQSTPSPSGTMQVNAVAPEPNYTVSAENLADMDSDETFVIAPGPNGPVGSTWIDLSKDTYGIHGTPYPSKMNTMQSNGCVRLTNWDASELAQLVSQGVEVSFTGS
jgi:lipoprotein-anchoring transpeptidase ErfK/SrfK